MIEFDWEQIDRHIVGEAWVGSKIERHVDELCRRIGPRWASTEAEHMAAEYARDQLGQSGYENAHFEEFELDGWRHQPVYASIPGDDKPIEMLPMLNCPQIEIEAPIVDVGFGMPYEIESSSDRLANSIAVVNLVSEPFSNPIPHPYRITALADKGAAAVVVVDPKSGGHLEYWHATDKRRASRAGEVQPHPVPTVTTTREGGSFLRACATEGKRLRLAVSAKSFKATAFNVVADLEGSHWPQESIVVGAHHDTVIDSPGGNDNASGTSVVLETARVLNGLGTPPGRTIRFCTWSAEEQNHQGSAAFVRRHYGIEPAPRLAINLDEVATGPIKGVVLQFPHLRSFIQETLDSMGDELQCHVLDHVDSSGDGFSFSRAAIPAAMLWRWRFVGRHPDANYHHEPHDTADKVRPRELRDYVAQLSRILLRLSHVPPEQWPENPLTIKSVERQFRNELGNVGRTM